jgi:DEAD/DEAH box helicase domain-containing protein
MKTTAEDHIVVDVEIKRTIEETPGGWNSTDTLGVSCAVVYEFRTDRFRIFGDTDDDLERLKDRLIDADRISGYNIWKFDFPCTWGLPNRGRVEFLGPKTNDILRRIWMALGIDPDPTDKTIQELHKGWSLDTVTKGTLGGVGKIGHGAKAPAWYKAGEIAKLHNYCVDDVALERDLAIFVDNYGYVVNNVTGQVLAL